MTIAPRPDSAPDLLGVSRWERALAFGLSKPEHIAGVIDSLRAVPSEIFTSRLVRAIEMFRYIEAGRISVIGVAPRALTPARALGILANLATYDRLSQLPGVRLRPGAAWLKMPRTTVLPTRSKAAVMPLAGLAEVSGCDVAMVQAAMAAFERDGAVRLVQVPDAGPGVALMDGVIQHKSLGGL